MVPGVSRKIQTTLDPCVVLMKDLIGRYAEKWKHKGIYSLAQGIVYWNPPETCNGALIKEISNPDSQLHLYGKNE